MSHRIHPIVSKSCGPTAVCSVTGKSSEMVLAAMKEAAAEDGRPDHHWKDSAFKDQARACEILGFDLFDGSTGDRISAATLPMNPNISDYDHTPTIREFSLKNNHADVLIGFAVARNETHTFVLDGKSFFDCNTGGRIVPPHEIPAAIADFKVIAFYAVRSCNSPPA